MSLDEARRKKIYDDYVELVKDQVKVAAGNKGPVKEVEAHHHLANDLGIDSLGTMELILDVEEKFGIEIPDGQEHHFLVIEDAVIGIEHLLNLKEQGDE
jgi:acyl carrier protein